MPWRAGRAFHLVVTGTEDDQEMIVGGVGLRMHRTDRVADLGYWVGRRFWGHGVASEAAGRLVRWALANLDLDRIEASVATDNPGSMSVLREDRLPAGRHRHAEIPGPGRRASGVPLRGGAGGHARRQAESKCPPARKPLLLVAACALIDTDGRILLARRPEGKKMAGLWEFPGGKLDPGETPEAAVIRELHEELGIDIASKLPRPLRVRQPRLRKLPPADAPVPLPSLGWHADGA